jgi:TonB family protein
MRFLVAGLALVLVAGSARADSDPAAGSAAMSRLLAALERGVEADVVAALGAKVKLDGAKFADAACQKAFGGTVTVRGAKRTKLAACLVATWKAKKSATEPVVAVAGKGWNATLSIGSAKYALAFAAGKGGAAQVAAITVDGGAPKKLRVKELVQPVKIEKQVEYVEEGGEAGDPYGEEGGVEGGIAEGWVGGEPGGVVAAPPPPPPPPAPPQNVAPTVLEGQRIVGDKHIQPDDVTKVEIARSGKEKIVASFKLCVDARGAVTTVNLLKSSGFPAYDRKLQAGIKAWRYKPYLIDDKPAPVCTAVTFIYSQPAPDPPPASP